MLEIVHRAFLDGFLDGNILTYFGSICHLCLEVKQHNLILIVQYPQPIRIFYTL